MSKTVKQIFLVNIDGDQYAYLNDSLIMMTYAHNFGASGWSAKDVAQGLSDFHDIEIQNISLSTAVNFPNGWLPEDIHHYTGSRYLLQLVLGIRAQSSRRAPPGLRDGLGTARCSNGSGRPAPVGAASSSSPQQGGLNIAAMTGQRHAHAIPGGALSLRTWRCPAA